MKTYIALLVALGLVGISFAADYTPASKENESFTALTPTSNAEIAVAAGICQFTAAAASTNNTIASPAFIGSRCTLVNVGANAVTITDGTNIEGAGAMAMGQYDTLELVAISTAKWIEVSRSDN
jgi:hypothetical protein